MRHRGPLLRLEVVGRPASGGPGGTPTSEGREALPALDPIEICSGVVLGRRRSPRPWPVPAGGRGVRAALEATLLPRLESAPCFFAFSGGRDSAALLALATRLARERRLADPVPVTLRFEHRPRTDERDWQEMAIERLGLRRWEILPIRHELDPLSPLAQGILRRHGLVWPPVVHRVAPLLAAARGHVLVMGTGGDEMFSPWSRSPIRRRLDVRVRPLRRAARRAAFNLLPETLRVRAILRRRRALPWLRPPARAEVERIYRDKLRQRSASWAEAIGRIPESRNFELTQAAFAALAAEAGASLVQPFLDPGFIRAVGESAPRRGFSSRAAAMELHFGDVLPPALTGRSTKAVFDELHAGPASRAFALGWDGRGLDVDLVDPEALRREWLSPRPDYRSLTALNAAWLASGRNG